MVYVDTNEFEREHGKTPRGYGGWGFTLTDGKEPDIEFWASNSYGEARKEAKSQAKAKGYETIVVLP